MPAGGAAVQDRLDRFDVRHRGAMAVGSLGVPHHGRRSHGLVACSADAGVGVPVPEVPAVAGACAVLPVVAAGSAMRSARWWRPRRVAPWAPTPWSSLPTTPLVLAVRCSPRAAGSDGCRRRRSRRRRAAARRLLELDQVRAELDRASRGSPGSTRRGPDVPTAPAVPVAGGAGAAAVARCSPTSAFRFRLQLGVRRAPIGVRGDQLVEVADQLRHLRARIAGQLRRRRAAASAG